MLRGLTAVRLILKPIFSPWAIDSSVVPVLEHSFLNFIKSWFSLKCSEIGWSIDTAKKEKANAAKVFYQLSRDGVPILDLEFPISLFIKLFF